MRGAAQMMCLIDEKLGCHSAEPICRSRDKDTRHIDTPETCLETSKGTIDTIGNHLNVPTWIIGPELGDVLSEPFATDTRNRLSGKHLEEAVMGRSRPNAEK
jgi:hypothetical protein